MDPITHQLVLPPKPGAKAADLQKLATEFEAVFLAQMIKSAGLGKAPTGFGGGTGEGDGLGNCAQSHAGRSASAWFNGLFTRPANGTSDPGRADVYDRWRHGTNPAHSGGQRHPGDQVAPNARWLRKII